MSDTYRFRCSIEHIVDGDTYDVKMELFFGLHYRERIRLRNLDTNEIYGVGKDTEEYQKGKHQMEWARNWLEERDEGEFPFMLITTENTGKYGRYIGVLEDRDTGEKLNNALREEFPHIANEYSTTSEPSADFGIMNERH